MNVGIYRRRNLSRTILFGVCSSHSLSWPSVSYHHYHTHRHASHYPHYPQDFTDAVAFLESFYPDWSPPNPLSLLFLNSLFFFLYYCQAFTDAESFLEQFYPEWGGGWLQIFKYRTAIEDEVIGDALELFESGELASEQVGK